jgi:eukaryotic-like serine/threonine-protein kinase
MRTVSAQDVETALGPFDSLTEIGEESGSGECWRVDRGGQVLALKVIVKEHEPGRFERELEALKRMSSPRVMHVDSDGTLQTASGAEYPYLLSEFVPGGDVSEHLSAGTPDDRQLRAFLLELFRALGELHDADIVHRDLKPQNVILRDGNWETPVVIDLGLSRLVDSATFTVYPWAWGTWPYMAPEQLQADRAIDRTDVWAVGVIAAEAAAGEHPFRRPGEGSPPSDWDDRLRAGMTVPGSRPAALHELVANAGQYRAYRRPTAAAAIDQIEGQWT